MNKYFNLLLILLFHSSFNSFLLSMTPDERAMFDALEASEKDEKDRRDRQRQDKEELDFVTAMSLSLQDNDMPKKVDPKMQRVLNNQLAMTIRTFFSDMDLESNFNHPSIPKEQFFKNINKIKELISKGADINTEVSCQYSHDYYIIHTILSLISANIFNLKFLINSEEFIKFLIQNGADINFITKGKGYIQSGHSCLHHIVYNSDNLDFIKFVIRSKGVNFNIREDVFGQTLLRRIIAKSEKNNDTKNILEIIEYLINSGQIDINHQDTIGNTVLHYLLDNEKLDPNIITNLFILLINGGADPNIPNYKNKRVLDRLSPFFINIYSEYKKNIKSIITNHTPCYNDVSNIILSYL